MGHNENSAKMKCLLKEIREISGDLTAYPEALKQKRSEHTQEE